MKRIINNKIVIASVAFGFLSFSNEKAFAQDQLVTPKEQAQRTSEQARLQEIPNGKYVKWAFLGDLAAGAAWNLHPVLNRLEWEVANEVGSYVLKGIMAIDSAISDWMKGAPADSRLANQIQSKEGVFVGNCSDWEKRFLRSSDLSILTMPGVRATHPFSYVIAMKDTSEKRKIRENLERIEKFIDGDNSIGLTLTNAFYVCQKDKAAVSDSNLVKK